MSDIIAKVLIGGLEEHPPLTPKALSESGRSYFIDLLVSTEVPQSTRFYEEVKPNGVTIRGADENQRHIVSISIYQADFKK